MGKIKVKPNRKSNRKRRNSVWMVKTEIMFWQLRAMMVEDEISIYNFLFFLAIYVNTEFNVQDG